MFNVYLVKGNTGEYEDRSDWVVKAYTSSEKASDLVGALNILVEGAGKLDYDERDDLVEKIRETLDPDCDIDYTGDYYNIEIIEVDDD